jgi:tetratricopeptide (TPR) repeat protein
MNTPLELAGAFIQAGELNDALNALDAHLSVHPHDQEAHRLRASVLTHLPGRARDALSDLDALDVLAYDDLVLSLQVRDMIGEPYEAVSIIEQAWLRGGDPRAADLLLRRLRQQGEIERALELLADLPKSWQWLGWSGDLYALKGDYATAAEHYCSAIDQLDHGEKSALTETVKAHLLLKRADAYRRLRQYDEADADYQAAEAIIPTDPMIPFNRGLLIFEQSGLRRALPLCRDALDHAPAALRDHMRDVLRDDPRYHLLAQALLS